MKKVMIVLIVSLTFSVVIVGNSSLGLSWANPYFPGGEVPPPTAEKPKIIVTLENNSILSSNNISFKVAAASSELPNFTDKIVTDKCFLTDVYCTVDWKTEKYSVYNYNSSEYWKKYSSLFRYVNLTEIPEGNHTLKMFVNEVGTYVISVTKYWFNINSSLLVNFTVDSIKPNISISVENKTYETNNILFNFTINEAISNITYCLDGKENVTTTENFTLTNLTQGFHNVTVYATDFAGNVGSSEILTFTVNKSEPFPTLPITASIGIVTIVVASLLVYSKKHKHRRDNT